MRSPLAAMRQALRFVDEKAARALVLQSFAGEVAQRRDAILTYVGEGVVQPW